MNAPQSDTPDRVAVPPPGPEEPIWTAGIVNHGSYEDLANCLESLVRQALPPSCIYVYDTGLEPEKFEAVRKAHPLGQFECGPNRGYAGGANRVLERSIDRVRAPDFCLILNPDIVLDPDHAQRLIDAMTKRPDVAIAGGKLLRPGRKTIDSAGIRFPRHGRPRDRGSEEQDRGQFDVRDCVDAISGAAMMIRVAAIPDLRIEGQLFDEDFFAYHEDTDLCWRARRLGWKILYEPTAIAVHARGWQKPMRSRIDPSVRRHSFKNHYLQLVKNQTIGGFVSNLPWILTWEVLRFGFVLLRDRAMLRAYGEAWRAMPGAVRKRRVLNGRSKASVR